MTQTSQTSQQSKALRQVLAPLALAQFICSFAGSNMNVMINDISEDLDTTVQGVQIAITIFLLVMAALMIPGGKLTDRYGRKRCFIVGLVVYGVGALLSAAAPGWVCSSWATRSWRGWHRAADSAGLHPDHAAVHRPHVPGPCVRCDQRVGRIGAAAGPLIGGLITSAISWRAAFVFQALIIAVIVLLSRKIHDPLPRSPPAPSTPAVRSCPPSASCCWSRGSWLRTTTSG